jgi:hypothetical protein
LQIPKFQLLWFGAEYPASFFGFGYPRKRESYKSWLLQDPSDNRNWQILWKTNAWTHICFAFNGHTQHVRFVKVGKV